MMKKYIKVFFIISVLGLVSCGTFHGPGALQGPDYHPSVPVEAPVIFIPPETVQLKVALGSLLLLLIEVFCPVQIIGKELTSVRSKQINLNCIAFETG